MTAALLSAPGFLVVSIAAGATGPDLHNVERVLGAGTGTSRTSDTVVFRAGTGDATHSAGRSTIDLLSRAPRRHEHPLNVDDVQRILQQRDPEALRELLPPFAAVSHDRQSGEVVAATDPLGYRHLYARAGDGWAAVSTSARALAACEPKGIDNNGVGMQALLGWQVGLDTPFNGVRKLPPGATALLQRGELTVTDPQVGRVRPVTLPISTAVDRAAAMLRANVSAVLDDHPDVVLQLTGGQDSRVLLGAIEPARRRGLEVMTLASPGNPDAEIAASLAQRYGMRHQIIDLAGLADVDPEEAHAMAVVAARRLDCSANPVAEASIAWAESRIEQHPRLAGLGGEVARGFYYVGPFRDVPVTRSRVRRLAEWRMFTNESMARQALDPGFATAARERAVDQLFHIFEGHGRTWFAATDEFYLLERMHRWSGVVASTTSMDRITINPMLDDRFLTIARGLHPRDKQNSLFLSRLSCALDTELSDIPLDGRPSPRIYAQPTATNRIRRASSTGQKIVGKVRQRLAREGRPPAGADLLAPKIAEYYRAHPDALSPVRDLGLLSPIWLDATLNGAAELDPGSAAMLVNLEVIADAVRPSLSLRA
jgi:asparagine synthase (glutamine-hydrolysing)